VVNGRQYEAERCWSISMLDVADPALTALYFEFRVPLDLPVPALYLLARGSDYKVLWVFDGYEGSGCEDMLGLARLLSRLAELSAFDEGAGIDLLDATREVMIVEVVAPLAWVVDYLKASGSESLAASASIL
jgi:hypothetical protein